jgi:hypothetical protein
LQQKVQKYQRFLMFRKIQRFLSCHFRCHYHLQKADKQKELQKQILKEILDMGHRRRNKQMNLQYST